MNEMDFSHFEATLAQWAADRNIFVTVFLALLILVIGYALSIVLAKWTKKVFIYFSHNKQLNPKRLNTFASVLSSVVRIGVMLLAVIQVLALFGLGSTAISLLAAAGVGGLAISFGAQNLVRDLVSGMFMLWENQYSVGDFVQIGTFRGRVEEFRPRITVLRAPTGELHTIPNGSITSATNFSRGQVQACVEIAIAIRANPTQALDVMQRYLQERFSDDAPKVLGVIKVRQNAYVLGCTSTCRQGDKLDYERAMLACILRGFSEESIPLAGGIIPTLTD